jgi:hypothetical protein|nr:MAG TPA: hypothetical protein [Caudoviricetes sp.]
MGEQRKGTLFSAVYNRFLGKITDDMYIELTPEDTIKDLQNLLIDAIPGFEFPRQDISNYTTQVVQIKEDEVLDGDFIIGVVWDDLEENIVETPDVLVDRSCFAANLTSEEINILALLMKQSWVQRQVNSIENTRMKYYGSDFKMTSQANHLSKLMNLLETAKTESFHMQRLYKRRRLDDKGYYHSNWTVLRERSALDANGYYPPR